MARCASHVRKVTGSSPLTRKARRNFSFTSFPFPITSINIIHKRRARSLDKTPAQILLVSLFLWLAPTLHAQDKKPLKCGTDDEGGIPYYFGSKNDPNIKIGF